MLEVAPGWSLDVDRGPDWLFVRLQTRAGQGLGASGLADAIWELMQQQFAHRLVLELDELSILPSELIGELVRLYKRVSNRGGLMRLCGLSDANLEALKVTRMDRCFPHYRNREDAVMGHSPVKPR